MINTFISAILQVIAFSLIPLLVYLIQKKTFKGFISHIGLKKANLKANLYALGLMIALASPMLILFKADASFRDVLLDPKTVTGSIRAMGFGVEGVMTVLLIAVIKTGLSEEIFFRGFLAKRLIAITSYQIGNWLQAVIFGVIHLLLFLNQTDDWFFLSLIFIMPTIGAYAKVYLNEKLANGSILPGWIAHASANVTAY